MISPLVSCICPTYGRVPFDQFMLEECVYWFTRQTYANAELIILSDATEQTIVCSAPRVKVVNLSRRFATLGDKYNYLCSISRGELILPWEDDDISLPGRIEQTVHALASHEYWKPGGEFYQNGPLGKNPISLCSPGNVFHNGSGFRKSLWERIKYPSVSGPQDAAFDALAYQHARVNRDRPTDPKTFQYCYRWQAGSGRQPNLSGHSDPNVSYLSRPAPVAGVFEVVPTMHADYVALTDGVTA